MHTHLSFEETELKLGNFRFSALAAGPVAVELALFLHGFPQFADSWTQVMRPIAQAGFRCVAVDQRGYSSGARPPRVEDYSLENLLSDIRGFIDALGHSRVHLVGHDWGGLLAWAFAAQDPDRLSSIASLATPHPAALFQAFQFDEDQMQRSKYIALFRLPGGVAEDLFQANDYAQLRAVYQGMLSPASVAANIARLSQPGALTATLNWYRALNFGNLIGKITVPTLYVWGSRDLALGQTAALDTAACVSAPYRFEKLDGISHWLLEEVPENIAALLLQHFRAHPVR